jgi:hypothetical protein
VFWKRKGSTTTIRPAAYRLSLQAFYQGHYGYAPLHEYITGEVNLMVDVASRSGDLTDFALLEWFESKFRQTLPWTLCQLRKPISTALTSTLLTTRSKSESFFSAPKPRTSIGRDGTILSLKMKSTHLSGPGKAHSPSCNSLVSATATAVLPPATIPCKLEKWRMHFVRSARRSPRWGLLMS